MNERAYLELVGMTKSAAVNWKAIADGVRGFGTKVKGGAKAVGNWAKENPWEAAGLAATGATVPAAIVGGKMVGDSINERARALQAAEDAKWQNRLKRFAQDYGMETGIGAGVGGLAGYGAGELAGASTTNKILLALLGAGAGGAAGWAGKKYGPGLYEKVKGYFGGDKANA